MVDGQQIDTTGGLFRKTKFKRCRCRLLVDVTRQDARSIDSESQWTGKRFLFLAVECRTGFQVEPAPTRYQTNFLPPNYRIYGDMSTFVTTFIIPSYSSFLPRYGNNMYLTI